MRWVLVCMLAMFSCNGPSPSLRIDLRTDLVPQLEMQTIDVELSRDGVVEGRSHTVGSDSYIDGVRVAEFRGLAQQEHRIVVTVRGPDLVMSQTVVAAVRGDTAVTVLLTRDCLGVRCESPAAATCLNGRCVSSTCTGETLRACGAPMCEPSQCDPLQACAASSCESGVCLVTLDSSVCDAGERCDPMLGCVSDATDAGLDGSVDAFLDARSDAGGDAGGDAGEDRLSAEEIVVGQFVACSRLGSEVTCWGNNIHGAVGHSEAGALSASVVPVSADRLAASATTMCARSGPEVHCWGDNSEGQLGQGDTVERRGLVVRVPLPFAADGLDSYAGGFCALSDGMLSCWGSNRFGQAAPADPAAWVAPTAPREVDVDHVDGGFDHLCFRTTSDAVFCHGRGLDGELGDGAGSDSRAPVEVTRLEPYAAIAAVGPDVAVGSTCALGMSGSVYCWGANDAGQLGASVGTLSLTPVMVSSLTNVTELLGTMRPMFARLGSGDVMGWGDRSDGLFGEGGADRVEETPVPTTLGRFGSLAFGAVHACGIDAGDQTVWCWGRNDGGTLPGVADDAVVGPSPIHH